MLTHIELFAGISGFGLGFEQSGIVTIATVEKDAKARALLQYHYPNILHLDDVKTAGKHNLPYADIISFGSPCQDLSIAGKRKGLEGERSGLFWEAIRIVDECKPAFAVWENVADAISSNAGRDFALILGGFRDIGARDIAWRTVDAQYFGVPQRRRRIFLVADFRGERAGQILFESEGSEGDFKPRRKKGQGTAARAETGVRNYRYTRFGEFTPDNKASTLRSQAGGMAFDLVTVGTLAASGAGTARPAGQRNELDFLIPFNKQRTDEYKSASVGSTLAARDYKDAGDLVIAFDYRAGDDSKWQNTPNGGHCGGGAKQIVRAGDYVGALNATKQDAIAGIFGVRRLTPVECEKLQGFPCGWTAVNNQSDSTRYKQLGNAVCVNVSAWIGQRIMQVAFNSLWKEDAS